MSALEKNPEEKEDDISENFLDLNLS